MGFSTPQDNSNIMISGLHIDIVVAKKNLWYKVVYVCFPECFCRELGVRHLGSLIKSTPTDFMGASYRFGWPISPGDFPKYPVSCAFQEVTFFIHLHMWMSDKPGIRPVAQGCFLSIDWLVKPGYFPKVSSHSWLKQCTIPSASNISASEEDAVIEAKQIINCDENKNPQKGFLSFTTERQEGSGTIF